MATISKSNSDNFLTWQNVDGLLPLSFLQRDGINGNPAGIFRYSVTVSASQTIGLPMVEDDDTLYDFVVNYGDGDPEQHITTFADPNTDHTYTDAGTYDVEIEGLFDSIDWSDSPTSLIEIKQWGVAKLIASSFSGCSNFTTISATDTPLIFGTSLATLFLNCTSFNGNVSFLNTSTVTTMVNMFNGCSVFNQSVSSFDTALVTSFAGMFDGCTIFNQPLPFDTGLSITMAFMLNDCPAFDQDLSAWDVGEVLTLEDFMAGSQVALSTVNYDLLLIGWDDQTVQTSGFDAAFGLSEYTGGGEAAAARAGLIANNWAITDGGIA